MNAANDPFELAARQNAFLDAILDENAPLPTGWGNSQAAGMAVYRGNYRSALMETLASTYERTSRYIGPDGFRQASINHVITHPPSGWTIDEAGLGFEQSCLELFPNNPEVAELAWLEWSMLTLVTAPDTQPIGPEDFGAASADFGDEEWSGLTLAFQPRATARLVSHNLTALWKALGEDGLDIPLAQLETPQSCLVWREGERPTFILAEADHVAAFEVMQSGASYSDVIGALLGDAEPTPDAIQDAAMRAGGLLGRWLQEGLLIAINP